MNLGEYFETHRGVGVLASADAEGNVDLAVYARPHVLEDGTVAFIMRDKLTHRNVRSNPRAVYLFLEEGPGYHGKRLYLTMTGEEQDTQLLESLRRRTYPKEEENLAGPKFLVRFRVDRVIPAVGAIPVEFP